MARLETVKAIAHFDNVVPAHVLIAKRREREERRERVAATILGRAAQGA